MSKLLKLDRGNRLAFLIGAILGVLAIKTQPDGNLLVTTVCAVIAGTFSLIIWNLLKKLRTKLR
jgi:hypothetical protein